LLTVVMHELGHSLGLDDLATAPHDTSLMGETLGIGMRRVPNTEVSISPPFSEQDRSIALIGLFGNPTQPAPLQQAPPVAQAGLWNTYLPGKRFSTRQRRP
jgi:hypothetical protein